MGLTQTSEGGVKISNAGTNGQFLQKQSGNTGGLTWADVPAGVGGGNGADFNDNVKIRLGTGNDLQIYHNGSNSFIEESGTGALYIDSNHIILRKQGTSEVLSQFAGDGAASLYYDNSKKFETTSTGASMDGLLNFNGTGGKILLGDNGKIQLGGGPDLEIYHNGSNSKIDNTTGTLYIQGDVVSLAGAGGSENLAVFNKNGAVSLYYDNSEKFKTYSGGVEVTGLKVLDSNKLKVGNAEDLQIFHDGTNNEIMAANGPIHFYAGANVEFRKGNSSSYEAMLKIVPNGGVELYYDNTLSCYTTNGGISFPDNQKIFMGGSNDLQIFHDATTGHSRIKDTGTGNLALCSSKLTVWNAADNEAMMEATENGAVELYYDNSKKLETKSTGVKATGELEVTSNLLLKSSNSQRLYFGGNNDLQIYHNGTNGQIDNNTGNLELRNTGSFGSERQLQIKAKVDENSIVCKSDGPVELYHNNSKKLETTSAGGTLHGEWGTGKVIQYAYTNNGTHNTYATGSAFDNISQLNTSITPSSSSNKILIFIAVSVGNAGYPGIQLLRGSTIIGQGAANSSRRRATFAGDHKAHNCNLETIQFTYLDSPSTTSSTTYKVKISSGQGYTIRYNHSEFSGAHGLTATSTMMLQEIKG